jgi:YHS domain-containing protein
MTSTSLKAKLESVKTEFEKSVNQFEASAGADAKKIEQRYRTFQQIRQQVADTIVRPRLEEVASEFPGVKHTLTADIDGGTDVLIFPRTPERSAMVEVTLSVTHDDEFERVSFDYELRIIPVFIDFEKSSHLSQPLDRVDLTAVEAWLDDVLTGFARTYLNMQFVEQYQRDNLTTDLVLNRRFPCNLAAGCIEHKGVKYNFASVESMQLFEANPEKYLRLGGSASPSVRT